MDEVPQLPKKRTRKPENWVRNIKKKANIHGEEKVKPDGTIVPARQQKDVNCSCNPQCQNKFTDHEKASIFNQFYRLNTHTEQNLHLRSLISNTGKFIFKYLN